MSLSAGTNPSLWLGGCVSRWDNGFHSSGEEAVSQSSGVNLFPQGRGTKSLRLGSLPSNPAVKYRVRWWKRNAHNPLCCILPPE